MTEESYDVIVVGSGNAGFCAAVSARENGASKVLILEKAPESWIGGNTTFTAGAYRTVFHGLQDVLPLVHNVTPELENKIDMKSYTEEDFMTDLKRMTNNKTDPELASVLVKESNTTTKWLAANGIKFQLSFNRQAYEIDGRFRFWGGMVLSVVDGGKGLTQQHLTNAKSKGIEIRFESPVVGILTNSAGAVTGVTVQRPDKSKYDLHAKGGVVLCAGGFESSSEMRKLHMGPEWEKAHVRGTPYNTGDLLKLCIDELDAQPAGRWTDCHSTCWDANTPLDTGNQALTNQYTKSGYPLGIMVNTSGQRFVDEGEDLRNYTYAKFGKAILKQDEGIAFQIFDAEGAKWLRSEEYSDDVVERITSENSVTELAAKLVPKGLRDLKTFFETICLLYNPAVEAYRRENPDAKFDPSIKDGLSTKSSTGSLGPNMPDKTNWALPIVKPPFLAVKVACGITFTFGGLKIDPDTCVVMSNSGKPIMGLYAAGEMVGGLFYENYPGGSGLTSGAVFGRRAGRCAAQRAIRYG